MRSMCWKLAAVAVLALWAGFSPVRADLIITSGGGTANANTAVSRFVIFGDADSQTNSHTGTGTASSMANVTSTVNVGGTTTASASSFASQTVSSNPTILTTNATANTSYSAPGAVDAGLANANAIDTLFFTLTSPTEVLLTGNSSATNGLSASALIGLSGQGIAFGVGFAGVNPIFSGGFTALPLGSIVLPAGDYVLASAATSSVAGGTSGSGESASSISLQVVPEPTTMVLFGLCAVAGGGVAWRRRRAQAA